MISPTNAQGNLPHFGRKKGSDDFGEHSFDDVAAQRQAAGFQLGVMDALGDVRESYNKKQQ